MSDFNNNDLLCKDVYSAGSLPSLLTGDHCINFQCNFYHDGSCSYDLCFNDCNQRLSNTSGETPADNTLHPIVSHSEGTIFAPNDELESCPRVITTSNDTSENDMNHLEVSNTISEIRIKNLNNIIICHLNVNSLPNKFSEIHYQELYGHYSFNRDEIR